jgi:hypothetical protein
MVRTAALRAETADRLSPDDNREAALPAVGGLAKVLADDEAPGDGEGSAVTVRIELAISPTTIEALFAAIRGRDIALALGLPLFSDELEASIGVGSATRKAFQLAGLPASRVEGKADPRFFPAAIGDWFRSYKSVAAPRGRGRPRKRGS